MVLYFYLLYVQLNVHVYIGLYDLHLECGEQFRTVLGVIVEIGDYEPNLMVNSPNP